jgi:hypothetical protein
MRHDPQATIIAPQDQNVANWEHALHGGSDPIGMIEREANDRRARAAQEPADRSSFFAGLDH